MKVFIIYRHDNECSEMYQFEQCSEGDIEHDLDIILIQISRTLSQSEVDMSQAFK